MGKIHTIGDFQIWESEGHGKNVKGGKMTSSIQVREYIRHGEYLLLNSFGFKVGSFNERNAAVEKALKYAKEQAE